MRILFVADGRSPIALNWIQYFVAKGHEIHWVSTFPCKQPIPLASFSIIPVAFGNAAGDLVNRGHSGRGLIRQLTPVRLRTFFRQVLGPFTLKKAARQLQDQLGAIRPDLIHAMRIPYESMLATVALMGSYECHQTPLLVSIWGNDFTLHARSTPWMAHYTHRVLQNAAALHTDCLRDQRIAYAWGFAEEKPAVVLPGGGGVQMDVFYPPSSDQIRDGKEPGFPVIINPRGVRPYIRTDTFIKAIPLVLACFPKALFLCTDAINESQMQKKVAELNATASVEFLPRQTRSQMADLFRRSHIIVSPSTHDGTPNTLLEGMACGCFPVVGDLESIREWITHGENGLLVDPADPQALAHAIITAYENRNLRAHARQINTRLISEKAEYKRVMANAEDFYRAVMTVRR